MISVKRLIGRSLSDVQSRYSSLPYEFVASENGLPLIITAQGPKKVQLKCLQIFYRA